MINKPPLLKGLNIRIPIMIPAQGKGFIDHWSGLVENGGISYVSSLLQDPYPWMWRFLL